MSFVAGREVNTSICTRCYMTVRPLHGQALADAELAHQCDPSLIIDRSLSLSKLKAPERLHDILKALIPRYHANDVSCEERALLKVHVAFCAVCRQVFGSQQPPEENEERSVVLTQRQTEILRLVASGMTYRQMADMLSLSCKTVEFHRAGLSKALGVRTTAELTQYAIFGRKRSARLGCAGFDPKNPLSAVMRSELSAY